MCSCVGAAGIATADEIPSRDVRAQVTGAGAGEGMSRRAGLPSQLRQRGWLLLYVPPHFIWMALVDRLSASPCSWRRTVAAAALIVL